MTDFLLDRFRNMHLKIHILYLFLKCES